MDEKSVPIRPVISPKTKALIKQPHFWLSLIAALNGGMIAMRIVPVDSRMGEILVGISTVLGFLGYRGGVNWSPPRTRWDNDERIAHGLKPLPTATIEQVSKQVEEMRGMLERSLAKPSAGSPPFDKGGSEW